MSLILRNKRKRRCIPSEWDELPGTVIEQIYANLDRSDQLNMSLVCKTWSQEYSSPSVWKNFSFKFKKSGLDLEVWPEVKLAQKFGCMFRHVEVVVKYWISRKSFEKSIKQIQLFFESIVLSKCQLLSITFDFYKSSDRQWHEKATANLFQCVLSFMKTQNNLQKVVFSKCGFKKEDGLNLLRLICENNAYTLKSLVLDGFIIDRFESEENSSDLTLHYRTLVQSFMNLQTIKTEYSLTFENIMRSFSGNLEMQRNMTRKLSLIELECAGSKRLPLKGILPISWQNLRRIYPGVKVHFRMFYFNGIRNLFTIYLAKFIPLAHLEFVAPTESEDYGTVVIGELLRHLCDCKATQHLEYLNIDWTLTVENISTDFIPFLQACQKLKTLELFLSFPCGGLKELFDSWLQSCPVSLETVYISINLVVDEAARVFLVLFRYEYGRLLQTVGIKLTLLVSSDHNHY